MSGFNVSIVAGDDKSTSVVHVTGSVRHVITDEERTTFKLSDKQLKEYVGKYHGKKPKDAYLHSSTPWGDLYKTYNWPQVQTVVIAESAEILEVTSKPVAVKTQTFTNNSSVPATFNVTLTDTVTDTTTSSWSTGGSFTIEQKISYEVGFLGAGGGGETSFSYSASWGKGGEESKSVTVGSSSGVSVELDPGQSVVAELTASRGVMKIRIRYKSYLVGSTAVNYNPRYKGHHFFALGIGGVLRAGGTPNAVESTEDIEMEYYSSSKVDVKDNTTGHVVASLIQ